MVQHYHNLQSGLLNHASIKKVCYMQWPHHLCNIDNEYCMVNWSYSLGTNTKLKIYYNVHHHDVLKEKINVMIIISFHSFGHLINCKQPKRDLKLNGYQIL
jgi:hypothetical protein